MYYKPQLGDPNSPELAGRIYNQLKGKYSSVATDPWMKTRYALNESFLNWLRCDRTFKGQTPSLANLKAEVRNDYIRAGDLWEEYQISLNKSTFGSCQPTLIDSKNIDAIAKSNKERALDF